MDGGEQQFTAEGARVGGMSGRGVEKTLWRRATVQMPVVTQREIKAFGRSFDFFPKEVRKLVCCFVPLHFSARRIYQNPLSTVGIPSSLDQEFPKFFKQHSLLAGDPLCKPTHNVAKFVKIHQLLECIFF